jgi:DNA-binding NarL/FixJ family response regulator
MPITVTIVEDNDGIREGLAMLIGGSPGYRCLDTFATAEEALRGIPRHHPDVVLMDIHLPGMSGIECTQRLKEHNEAIQVMMLTVYDDDDQVFRSLVAGATGYSQEHSSGGDPRGDSGSAGRRIADV